MKMNNCWRIFFDVKEMNYYLFLHANGKVMKCEIARAMYEELNNILNIKEVENMTSKTSLKNLKDTMTNMYGGRLPLIDRLRFEIVEDDLETLELLKTKHVDIAELKEDDNVTIYNMSMMKQDRLSEEEFKLLKEWMEDDK